MGYKHFGVNTGGIPIEYMKRFTESFSIPIFIETGTAGGESVRAAAPLFRECHTIEIVENRPSGEFPQNVKLHSGDSSKLLASIASQYRHENIFFWLDAHWSEPGESPEDVDECPLLKEIDAIKGTRAIIMIDDARLFTGPPPWPCNPQKWPKLKDVFIHLMDCFPDHIITIVDDYIVCVPDSMRDVFRDEWRGRFNERYPSDEERLKMSTRDCFNALKKYME